MDDDNELSPIEIMALRVRHIGPDGEQEPPRLKMVSFRVPIDLLASVDAFASITAQSRNTTLIDLLKSGVYAVGNALDDPEQYFAAREHFLEQHIGE
jgi:hypothetical protein